MPVGSLADSWVSSIKRKNKDIFSELDVLLRALDRFFNVDNLPLSKEDMASRNFFDELSAARDTTLRIVGLLEAIIPETKKNIYWFQKFARSKFLDDTKRDALREELYKQDVPEKSLFLLYDTFINLKGIISDILKTEHIPYLTFTNIGQIVGREIRENTFFNPFKRNLNADFDVIENREVSRVVKDIRDAETKKYSSTVLLYLFRFLRYLRYADTSTRFGSLSSSLLIILLLRSEFTVLLAYLDRAMRTVTGNELRTFLGVIFYQASMESKRVFLQELREVFRNRSPQYLKGKIENSHGILRNLTEQSIVQLVQFLRPDVKGSEIFDAFITKREQSLRLREDVLILNRFLALVEDGRENAAAPSFRCHEEFHVLFSKLYVQTPEVR